MDKEKNAKISPQTTSNKCLRKAVGDLNKTTILVKKKHLKGVKHAANSGSLQKLKLKNNF